LFAARRDPTHPWTITEPQPVAADVVVKIPATLTLTLRCSSKDGTALPSPKCTARAGADGPGRGRARVLRPRAAAPLEARQEIRDDGAIAIKDLLPGQYEVYVIAPGFAPATAEVKLESDLVKSIVLEPQKTLRVLIADQKDRPVSRVIVCAEAEYEPGEGQERTDIPYCAGASGPDGIVVVSLAASSTKATLHVQHPRFGTAKHTVTLPATETKIVLLEPGMVAGELEEDGRPPQLGKWTIIVQAQDGADSLPRFATADAAGKFVVRGLQPGNHSASAIPTLRSLRSIGSAFTAAMTMSLDAVGDMKSAEFVVSSGEVAQVRLVVGKKADEPEGPAGTVHGTVFLDGKAAVGMIVHCATSRGRGVMVDERGGFDFGRVAAGSASLTVTDPSPDHGETGGLPIQQLWEQKIEVKDGADLGVDIQIRTTSMRGRVLRADSTPVAGAFVTVHGAAQRFLTTDSEGRFELTRLAEGEYALRAEHQEHGHGVAKKVQVLAGQPLTGVEVRLLPYVAVRGRVDLSRAGIEKHGSTYVTLEPDPAGDEHHVASGRPTPRARSRSSASCRAPTRPRSTSPCPSRIPSSSSIKAGCRSERRASRGSCSWRSRWRARRRAPRRAGRRSSEPRVLKPRGRMRYTGPMHPSSNRLSPEARQKIAEALNASLCDGLDLHGAIKVAHWNVKGPHFASLHPLFETFAVALAGFNDEIAERAITLGPWPTARPGRSPSARACPSTPRARRATSSTSSCSRTASTSTSSACATLGPWPRSTWTRTPSTC
jgi:hypothetical protein